MSGALPTAVIADACLRLRCPLRVAPQGIRPLDPEWRVSGPARPVQHSGSVDVFLEAIEESREGDVLVIDNQSRGDEGCVGDLVALEAKLAGLGGIVIWGCNRDSSDLLRMGFPVFSYGAVPTGPVRLDARSKTAFERAAFGSFEVSSSDWVIGDVDGVLFLPRARQEDVHEVGRAIQSAERNQAALAMSGKNLRTQFSFKDYLWERGLGTEITFREHLRKLEKSIEE